MLACRTGSEIHSFCTHAVPILMDIHYLFLSLPVSLSRKILVKHCTSVENTLDESPIQTPEQVAINLFYERGPAESLDRSTQTEVIYFKNTFIGRLKPTHSCWVTVS